MKKFLSVIIALILPIVLLCGCSAKQLTADEYQDEVISTVKNWYKAMDDWSTFCIDNVTVENEAGNYVYSFEKLLGYKSELKKKFNAVEDALDKIDKVGKPPAEYDEFHKKLKNGVSIEREWLSLQRDLLSAKSEEEFYATNEEILAHIDSTTDVSLSKVYIEEAIQWNIDVNNLW